MRIPACEAHFRQNIFGLHFISEQSPLTANFLTVKLDNIIHLVKFMKKPITWKISTLGANGLQSYVNLKLQISIFSSKSRKISNYFQFSKFSDAYLFFLILHEIQTL